MLRSKPVVLILSQEFDPTVDPVVGALTARGAEVVRVDLSYFPGTMTVTWSNLDGGRRVLRHAGREVDLDRLAGVWYRRPTGFDFGAVGADEARFAHGEAVHGIGGLFRATRCTWVNRPESDGVAELKPYQLAVARKVGLRVPRTLVTNDPHEVAGLLAAADRPIVYKALCGGVVHQPEGFATAVFTRVVGEELAENLDRVRHTTCMFQEYVDKAYEVRLTVIGNTFFPVVIRSPKVDWRSARPTPYGDFHPLPDEVVSRVQALLAELNLVYAALDLIVTPAGDHVFLEANPGGQFMWLQEELNLPLADHMAELLMAGGCFERGTATQIGY